MAEPRTKETLAVEISAVVVTAAELLVLKLQLQMVLAVVAEHRALVDIHMAQQPVQESVAQDKMQSLRARLVAAEAVVGTTAVVAVVDPGELAAVVDRPTFPMVDLLQQQILRALTVRLGFLQSR